MLWTRIASALVLGILVILMIQFGGLWGLFALLSAIVIIGVLEFSKLSGSKVGLVSRIFYVLLSWLFCLSALKPDWISVNLLICLAVFLVFLMEIVRREPDSALLNTSSAALGIIYVGWMFGWHLIMLRQMPNGLNLIYLLAGITWGGDIGAYLVGRSFGKHKIIPAISPGKSLEGYIAGIIFACLAALGLRYWLLPDIGLSHVLILGVGLAVIGQIGDLAESLLKRGAKVKDSGTLIPGHGGILDRCDSMIFITPALYYYALYVLY